MAEPEEALRILARIMTSAYLNDNQGGNATVGRTRKRVKKEVSLHRATRIESQKKPATNLRGSLLIRLVFSDKLGQFWAVSYREM